MSTINNALSKLAEQQSSTADAQEKLVRANITPVKSSRLVWAIGGFTLSLGIGAWAVTSTPNPIQTSIVDLTPAADAPLHATSLQPASPSNTSKIVHQSNAMIYDAPKVKAPQVQSTNIASVATNKAQVSSRKESNQTQNAQQKTAVNHSTTVAQVQTAKPVYQPINLAATSNNTATGSSMNVQHVELTHRQMADQAIDRASKALEANDFDTATMEYQNALRYVPQDETTRRKLAALYYGNREVRKSAELLEAGIKIDKNSNELRMSLATILIKEDQPEAALSALGYLPDQVSDKYLAMRAALAQQVKNNQVSLQSYQMLTKRDPENGRWWLGLGIQQERLAQTSDALNSYNKALTMVGLSSQSQSFIRDRITLLASLEQGAK